MKKRLIPVICLALSGMMLLSGCGSKSSTNQTSEQTINIVGFDYTSLDPSVISDRESFTTLTNVMEGLTREVKKDGKVTFELAGAEKMDKNADSTVYKFTIRDSKWSDGKAVSAKDYEFSWKRLSDSRVSQDYLSFLEEIGVKGAADCVKADPNNSEAVEKALANLGVKALDDKTLEVTLEQPTPAFESALSFKALVPQREDKLKELGDQYGVDYTKMVYNGPFIVSDYAKKSKIVYKKNTEYWDAANIKLETANCPIIEEPTTAVKMFEGQELDMTSTKNINGEDIQKLKAKADKGEINYMTGVEPNVYYYTFNTKSKLLSNTNIRKALSMSFDRQGQIDVVWKRHVAAWGLIPNGVMLGDNEYRKSVAEPAKSLTGDAKALLNEGLKELGMNASDVTLKLLMGPSSSITTAQSQFVQKQWQDALGIKIDISHAVDGPSYFKDRTKGNFDICAGGWGADYNDLASFFPLFMTGNGNNNGKYSNPEYDKLVKEAGTTMDTAKRLELYKKAEELLVAKDVAIAPYYYKDTQAFTQKYVKGMYLPLFNSYFDLKNVYVEGK
jgi:oligopeptide transport system substrate-binding protein